MIKVSQLKFLAPNSTILYSLSTNCYHAIFLCTNIPSLGIMLWELITIHESKQNKQINQMSPTNSKR